MAAEERPGPLPPPSARRQRQSAPLSWELWSDHPGYGLTPDRIWRIFQCAESGYPQEQCDLFDDLAENDPHLWAAKSARLNSVAGKTWVVQPGGADTASKEAAQALAESLSGRGINWLDTVEHQLDSVGYGYAASEIEWDFRDGLFYPAHFYNVPTRRMVFDPAGKFSILTSKSTARGEELERGHWFVTRQRHTNPARSGLMRGAAFYAMFKRHNVRDWVIAAEKFGVPHVVGIYESGASPEAKAALLKAVRDLGNAGHAVLSEQTRIVIHEAAQRSGDMAALHPSIVALCEAQISKLFTGSVLTSDTGPSNSGSWALGKVHANVRGDLVLSDANRIGHVFRADIGAPFIEWNGFKSAHPPFLKIQIVQELDQRARCDVFGKAQEMGFPISQQQFGEEMALRPADNDGDGMEARPSASPPAKEEEGDDDAKQAA